MVLTLLTAAMTFLSDIAFELADGRGGVLTASLNFLHRKAFLLCSRAVTGEDNENAATGIP